MFSDEPEKLVFNAKLITKVDDDRDRFFTITFFCDDRSFLIMEGVSKQCVKSYRYLSRQVILNPDTNQPFQDKEFFVGAKLKISSRVFCLTEAAPYTLDMMEAYTDRFPMSNLSTAVDILRNTVDKDALMKQFTDADRGNGVDSRTGEKIISSIDIIPQYAITINRRFSDGRLYDYRTLLNYL